MTSPRRSLDGQRMLDRFPAGDTRQHPARHRDVAIHHNPSCCHILFGMPDPPPSDNGLRSCRGRSRIKHSQVMMISFFSAGTCTEITRTG